MSDNENENAVETPWTPQTEQAAPTEPVATAEAVEPTDPTPTPPPARVDDPQPKVVKICKAPTFAEIKAGQKAGRQPSKINVTSRRKTIKT